MTHHPTPIEPSRDGKPTHGQPGSGGAPKGNLNALKSGAGHGYKFRRLVVGELPKGMVAVKREGRKYRRDLEGEVVAIKGEIDLLDAHLVDTASAATIQAGICRWLLRNRIDFMSVGDIRGCGADIVKAKEKRDSAVKALNLDAPPEQIKLETYIVEAENNNEHH